MENDHNNNIQTLTQENSTLKQRIKELESNNLVLQDENNKLKE